jgi:hypothetical protein
MKTGEGNDSLEAIAERLRLTRIAYGRTRGMAKEISQTEFANIFDMTPQQWCNAENCYNRVALDSALTMVKRIGVSLDWIYLGRRAGLPEKLASEISKLEKEARGVHRDWLDL